MKWNNFEIKSMGVCGKYELIKWDDKNNWFTVAFIVYNENKKDFNISSVGTRLVEYWVEHLDEYILRYLDLLRLQYEYD